MLTTDTGLDLRLTDLRCSQPGGMLQGLAAVARGGVRGACGKPLARVTLTPTAAAAAVAAGVKDGTDIVLCVNPSCGKALSDLPYLQKFLAILK